MDPLTHKVLLRERNEPQLGGGKYSFSCGIKIWTHSIDTPESFWKRCNGTQIFNWFMEDQKTEYSEEDGTPLGKEVFLKGDKNLYWIALSEKFGDIEYKNQTTGTEFKVAWGSWERHLTKIGLALSMLTYDQVFTKSQFKTLWKELDKIKKLDDMYDIPKYLGYKFKVNKKNFKIRKI